MDRLFQDFVHATQSVRKRPLLAAVAALSVAIGIGVNTAIFSVVDALLLSPLPGITEPNRLVEIGRTDRGEGFDTFSYPDFLDLRGETDTFADVAAFGFQGASVNANGTGRRLMGMTVSANYFQTLGVHTELGRYFLPHEDAMPGENPVVVISHRLWLDSFQGDSAVIGHTIKLSRMPFVIIGVAPPSFHGHIIGIRPDFFIPISMGPTLSREPSTFFQQRGEMHFLLLGRLAPRVSIDRANAVTASVMDRLRVAYPETNAKRGARVVQLGPVPAAGRTPVTAFTVALSGILALILLTICVNVAGMLLARAASRQRDVALRLTLGSSRARILRQFVLEALLIFAVGGLGGLAIAWWGTSALSRARLPVPVEVALDLRPDAGVLLLGLGLALATGLVFGLLPALQVSDPDLGPLLKEMPGFRQSRTSRFRRAFVVVQVAASITLLAAAGLFLRAVQHAASLPTGFDADGVYTTTVNLTLEGYEVPEGRTYYTRLLDRLHAIPGVTAAALAVDLPLDMSSSGTDLVLEDRVGQSDSSVNVDFNLVSAEYFTTLDIQLLLGRVFDERDSADGDPVLIVDRELAEQVWPGSNPLGSRVRFADSETWREVVGVVDRVPTQLLNERARPAAYVPLAQSYFGAVQIVVRGGAPVAASIRPAILELDPAVSITPVVSLADYTSIAILPQRAAALLITALGGLALFLCGLGIYGIVAHEVAQRRREIGLRMAIGARPRDVARFVFRHAVGVVLPGTVLGGVAALGVGQLLQGFLVGLSPRDPTALGIAVTAMTLVVLSASAVPAYRAASVKPLEALRQ